MKTLLAISLSLAFLAVTACDDPQTTGSNDPNAPAVRATGTVPAEATSQVREGGGPLSVDVTLNEFSVQAEAETAAPGNVEFVVKNLGDVQHEFIVVRWDGPVEGLPVEGAHVQLDRVDVVAQEGSLKGGDEREVNAQLSLGNYALLCNQPGHYESGMRTRFGVR